MINIREAIRTKKIPSTRMELLRATLPLDWQVHTYSPGDGVTRYRFFQNAPSNQSYFGPNSGNYTALGYKAALSYAEALGSGTPAEDACTYRVVRGFFNGGKTTIKTGLTLAEAQEHCSDAETSSSTCKGAEGKRRTEERGPWFDGYESE